MGWFNNLPFRFKVLLPLGVLMAMFLYQGVTSLWTIGNLGHYTHDVASNNLPAINYLLQADRDLYQALVAERSMIFVDVESDSFTKLKKSHAENVQQAHDRIAKFIQLATESGIVERLGLQEKISEYQQSRDQWEQLTAEIVGHRASNTRSGRTSAIELSFGKGATAFNKMRDVIDVLGEDMLQLAATTRESSESLVSSSRTQMSVNVGIGILLCVVLAVVFPVVITKPMHALIDHLRDIAEGEGDLTVRLDESTGDEMGQVACEVNRFIRKLQDLISDVKVSTQHFADASSRLTDIATQSNQTVRDQLSEVEQVVTAINEMTATVQEVARNAGEAAESARLADDQAVESKKVVGETIHYISDLAQSVGSASDVIHKLEEQSRNIGAVIEVIKGIAEQTNLLALNAAIEAARAGEQGRGFAVVADEVRGLASRTKDSTQEIETMIESLQASAVNAVGVMEQGGVTAQQSVEQAVTTEQALAAITKAISQINDMNAQIATAAEQQSAVTEEINRNAININTLAQQASQSSDHTAGAADELAGISAALERRLAQFKV